MLITDISTAISQVVMEYDGVVVEDTSHLQRMAWQKVAEEEGRSIPPLFLLQRAEGMKNDQVMPHSFCHHKENHATFHAVGGAGCRSGRYSQARRTSPIYLSVCMQC